ncbi:MAG TPA: hypothetical protein DCS93_25810 [Microscillaceae bacterium]|nr:hypothetical protein [Microscillaceae bacterium]
MIQNNDILDDITTLYEISLSIGSSLDLYENCGHFLTTLLSRKSLEYASVWLKESLVEIGQPNSSQYINVFSVPSSKSAIEAIDQSHPMVKILEAEPLYSVSSKQPQFSHFVQENNIQQGGYALYSLGKIGFLKLYSAKWTEPLSKIELNKLRSVIKKFAVSLEGCISHQMSLYEGKIRLQMEKELKEKDIIYGSVVEELQEGLLITNPDTEIIFANPRMEALSGYQLSELLHKKAYKILLSEENWPFVKEKIAKRKTGVSEKYEIEQIRKDGTIWWSQINASPYYNEQGQQIGIIALITDITEQKNSKDQLKESEQNHRLLFHQNPHPMLIFDPETLEIMAANDTTIEKYGYAREELLQMTIKDLRPKSEVPFLMKNLHNEHVMRSTHCLKDGTIIYVDITAKDITYNNRSARLVLIQDVTARIETESKLNITNSRIQALLQNMQAGILLEDPERKVVLANPVFCDMFDIPLSPEEFIGVDCRPFAEISKGYFKNAETFVGEIDDILTARNIIVGEELELNDGRVFERDYIPVFSDDQYLGHLWQYRDVTNKKKAEKILIKARQKAEESSQAKERFLANMSHEIRTPLNAIMGMQRLLEKTTLTDKQNKYLQAIGVSADNLLVIINDILDISKIEAGKLELEQVAFDLPKMIRHLVFTLNYKAEEKGIGLFAEIDPAMYDFVVGDSVRLNQILLNLVNNAIKFTDIGNVRVIAKVTAQDENTQSIDFQVIDTGKGIKQENLQLIFESFNQEDASITRRYGGTGLGLTIGKQLVSLFGGTLEVESEFGVGTTFSFSLTFEKGVLQEAVPAYQTNEDYTQKLFEKRILLAEDNQMNQFLATTILEEWGVIVEVAENGKEALEKFSENKYDLILMDMQMPLMDGVEATKAIRQRLNSSIPIIALTANAIKGDRQRCLEAGMNDYLTKPFAQNDLLEKILANLQELPVKTPSVSVHVPTKQAFAPVAESYNLQKLEKMMGGNKEHVRQMVSMFVQETPALIEEMQQAQTKSDVILLGKLAHKVKSSLDILDLQKMAKLARQIEKIARENGEESAIYPLVEAFMKEMQQVVAHIQNDPVLA